jgi:hypothetical protein
MYGNDALWRAAKKNPHFCRAHFSLGLESASVVALDELRTTGPGGGPQIE